jgi:hypothetical protein
MASAERLGMAESWFDGDFSRLLRAKLPKVKVSTLRSVQHHGSDALALEGRSAETRLARMLGRSKVEKALVWRAREENAVYLVSTRGPLGKAPEPAEFEVHAEARADVAKGEGA